MALSLLPAEIMRFCELLEEISGLHYEPDKAYLFEARLAPILVKTSVKSYGDLCHLLLESSDYRQRIIEALVTNESFFFREEDTFRDLPEAAEVFRSSAEPLVIWSVGCATGQEPYSILMALAEARWQPERVNLLGFDISRPALATAQTAIYSGFEARRGLSLPRRDRFFEYFEGKWRFKQPWTSVPVWLHTNVMTGLPQGLPAPNIIFCRNMLIYFRDSAKNQVLDQLVARLPPDGLLVLGRSENALSCPLVESLSAGSSFYRKRSS